MTQKTVGTKNKKKSAKTEKAQSEQIEIPHSAHQLFVSLQHLIKEVSLDRLAIYTGRSDIRFLTIPKQYDLTFDHWVCLTIVAYTHIKVIIRCHFTSRAARELASKKFENQELDPLLCHNYMSEYCNWLGGKVKNILTEVLRDQLSKSESGTLTIPCTTPSFDRGDPTQTELALTHSGQTDPAQADLIQSEHVSKNIWGLSWGTEKIVLTADLDLNEKAIFTEYGKDIEKLIHGIVCFQISDQGDGEWL